MSKDLKQKKSDYLLELALEEQLEQDEDMKKYPLSEDVEHPHVFSEEHEKRMQEIFKMADKVEHRSYRRKKYFQLAAGIALFLCLTTVTVTQVEAVRLPVFRFFSEVMEKSTYYGVEEVQTELQCPTPEQFSEIVDEAELSQWIMKDSGTELEGNIGAAYSKALRYELYDCAQKFHCQFLSYVSQTGTPGIVITFLPVDSSVITEKEYMQLLNKGIPELWVLSSKLCSNPKIIFDLQEQMETAYEKVTAPEQYIDRISYFSEWGTQSSGIYATARMIKQGADDYQMWYQIKLTLEAEYNDTSSWEEWELSEVQTLKEYSSMELSKEDMGKGTEKYYFLKGKLSQIEETEEFDFSFSPSSANLPANTDFYQKAILTDASGSLLVYIAPTALSKKELGDVRLHILQKVQNRDKDVFYIVVKSCLTE